jgi:hypothetical protein
MDPRRLSELGDEELLDEFQSIKPTPVFDAFFIGALIGIIIFSVAVSSWGLVTLVPLFLIHLFLKRTKRYEALKRELEERNLL